MWNIMQEGEWNKLHSFLFNFICSWITQDSVSFVLALQWRTLYEGAFYPNNLTSKALKKKKKPQ